jgi:hypothetical protein
MPEFGAIANVRLAARGRPFRSSAPSGRPMNAVAPATKADRGGAGCVGPSCASISTAWAFGQCAGSSLSAEHG